MISEMSEWKFDGRIVIYRNKVIDMPFEQFGECFDLTRDEFGNFHDLDKANEECARLNALPDESNSRYTGPYYVVA